MLKDGEDELEDLHPPGETEGRAVGLDHVEEDRQATCADVQFAAKRCRKISQYKETNVSEA